MLLDKRTIRRQGEVVRRVVSSALLLVAFGALALAGYQTATGRWHATPVLSGSMRPGLQPGDVVLTKRVPISQLRVRDVVVFHPPGEADRQTVHRIVKLTTKGGTTTIITRGDANTSNDVKPASLSGSHAYRVERVVPFAGYPAVWLSTGHHGIWSIVLGCLFLVAAGVTAIRPSRADAPVSAEEAEAATEAAADQHAPVKVPAQRRPRTPVR